MVAAPRTQADPYAHIVFSTDCLGFQSWQSEFLAITARSVGHEGKVTRIASGCTDEQRSAVERRMQEVDVGGLRVHFAPKAGRMHDNKDYKYFNKPTGLLHFLQHADPPVPDEEVLALLDPDMILLRPILASVNQGFLRPTKWWRNREAAGDALVHAPRISDGQPYAQLYGIGAQWLTFNRPHICGEASPCTTDWESKRYGPDAERANSFYSVGPPYIASRNDMLRIAKSWTDFCPRVYEEYAALLTEMYAYSLAAAHHRLPHFVVHNWMLSNVDADSEAWREVDEFIRGRPFACDESVLDVVNLIGEKMPLVLHYCQRYTTAAGFIWSKHRIDHGSFSCDKPLLQPPPQDAVQQRDGMIGPDGKEMGLKAYQRSTFMICYTVHAFNRALRTFKEANCAGGDANYEMGLPIRRNGYRGS